MDTTEILKQCSDKTPKFSFKDKNFTAKIVKVHDGDTVHAVFIPFNDPANFVIRLEGIDTCEINSKNEDEKKNAINARNILSELILNKIVTLKCGSFDKYGRLLAKIYIDDIDICEEMKKTKFTTKYDGGTKILFENRN